MIVVPTPLPGGEACNRTIRPRASIHVLMVCSGSLPRSAEDVLLVAECRGECTTARSRCRRGGGREVDRDQVTATRHASDVGGPERRGGDCTPRHLGEEEVGVLPFDLEGELVEGRRVGDALGRFRGDPGDAVRQPHQVLGGRMVEHGRGLEDDGLHTGGLADLRPTRRRREAERSSSEDGLTKPVRRSRGTPSRSGRACRTRRPAGTEGERRGAAVVEEGAGAASPTEPVPHRPAPARGGAGAASSVWRERRSMVRSSGHEGRLARNGRNAGGHHWQGGT